MSVASLEAFALAVDGRLDGAPLAVLLDVDGTLAPIAKRPGEAVVPAASRDALRALAALPRTTVALVSGRAAADAWRVAGVPGVWVIGNHGLELRHPDGGVTVDPGAADFEDAIALAARRLETETAAVQGTIVENKRWTISLHYRMADPGAARWLMELARDVAASLGLVTFEGRMIVELRPPVPVNKGTASVTLGTRVGALGGDGAILYAGDDRTDEDAFRELRACDARAVTIRIGGRSDGQTRETSAEFRLESPEELRSVLEWLIARRTPTRARV